ncbi:response regulator containing a CheY-like receiver domain and an HTH DNA-binding domain [Clostridium sp. CAG:768]|nr:response regulator containing a CheY-like receiver domain and an HTH DNA-binding domain [Clostridium sp. CAG:768]
MERLTNREQQVFNAILAGKRTCEIRKEMNIATSTIRTYYKHIYSKLFVNSKKELILKYKQ